MNIAIIGCGLIGNKRAKEIGRHSIRWLIDLDIKKAKKLARSLGSTHISNDWRKAINDKKVDIVFVSTSNDVLSSIALSAIKADKHVLVEKPAARNLSELGPLIARVKQKKVSVKVGFNHRFHPAILKAKEIVDANLLGPLMFIRARYGHGGRAGYDKEWRTKPKISGGGELIDQGMHLIDLSRLFLGDFKEASGFLHTYFWNTPVEDNAFLILKTKKKQIAWLHTSWTEWKNLFSFEIFGRCGRLHIEGLGGSYGVERLTWYKVPAKMGPPEIKIWKYPEPDRSWKLEFEEFLTAIKQNRQPQGNLLDAKAALDIVAKVYG